MGNTNSYGTASFGLDIEAKGEVKLTKETAINLCNRLGGIVDEQASTINTLQTIIALLSAVVVALVIFIMYRQ